LAKSGEKERRIFLSDYYKFHPGSHETEDEINSLLRGIDLQICLMRIIRSQIESCVRADNHADIRVREIGNRYGKSGYMADVELDDHGKISAIRYDWVDP
jgi:hypothetical protein